MKKSATLLMVVLIVSVLSNSEAVRADFEDVGYWPLQLPIVEENKTEIGLGKYLSGATLLLLQSGVFAKYWPDYGYAWKNTVDPEFCGGVLGNQVRENADIGNVRLVTQKPGSKGKKFVGIDLTSKLATSRDMKEWKRWYILQTTTVTLENLCKMIGDEEDKIWLQAAVAFAHDNAAIGLPTNAMWKKMDISEGLSAGYRKEYKPVWRGTIIEDVAGGNGEEMWKLGDTGKAIAWKTDKTGRLADKGVYPTQVNWAFEWSPEEHIKYYLFVDGQRAKEELSDAPSLALNDNEIHDARGLAALEGTTDLQIWSEIDLDVWVKRASVADLWLVTEYPIPSYALEPSLRLQGYGHW